MKSLKTRYNDHTGQRYHHLIFLRYVRPGGKGMGAVWQLRCDCGAITERHARDVTGHRIKTCGKCQFHHELLSRRPSQAKRQTGQFSRAYARELRRALEEGASFELTNQDFKRFYQQPCQGCGTQAMGSIIRVNTELPYTPDNCLPLCTSCRQRLGRHSLPDAVSFWVGFLSKLGFPVGKVG